MKYDNAVSCIAVMSAITIFSIQLVTGNRVAALQTQITKLEEDKASLVAENEQLNTDISKYIAVIDCNREIYNENFQQLYDLAKQYLVTAEHTTELENFKMEDVILLAKVMQTEAGVNNYEAQKAVGCVILNRRNSDKFPDTISDVIYQKTNDQVQFAVAYNGAIDRCILQPETVIVACKLLTEETTLPNNLLYFCADPVDFTTYATYYKTIEGTKFYTN